MINKYINMDNWLEESLRYFNFSFKNIEKFYYKIFIFLIYNDYSNRNIAILISKLFQKDENEIYFEIDEIIENPSFDKKEFDIVSKLFDENDYKNWVDSFD